MPRAISPIIDWCLQVLLFRHMEPLPVTSGHFGMWIGTSMLWKEWMFLPKLSTPNSLKKKKESLKLWNSQLCISDPQKVYFSFFFTWVVWFLNNFSLAPGFWTVDCSCSGIDFRLHRFIEIALNFKEPLSLSGRPVFVEVNKWLPYGELDLL